jgi:hypothetical protein
LQYLRKVLAAKYDLSFEERDKSVVDVDDVYALIEHHWADDTYVFEDERQRLQTDALINRSLSPKTTKGRSFV